MNATVVSENCDFLFCWQTTKHDNCSYATMSKNLSHICVPLSVGVILRCTEDKALYAVFNSKAVEKYE